MPILKFDWDSAKDLSNQKKHGVSFKQAEQAFYDPMRVIRSDVTHSQTEDRFFCFGKVDGKIMTVRFTMRGERIRIIGAAYWRKGKQFYE